MFNDRAEELSSALAQVIAERGCLKTELGQAAVERETLQAQNAIVGSRVAEVHDDIKATRKDLLSARAELQQVIVENAALKKTIDIQTGELNEAQATITGAKVECQNLVAKAVSAEALASRLHFALAQNRSAASRRVRASPPSTPSHRGPRSSPRSLRTVARRRRASSFKH